MEEIKVNPNYTGVTEEMKIGEYVRTKKGFIFKITEENINCCNHEKYLIKIELFDFIIKHSFNIIDLIEVGDYVNGYKVVNEIWGEDDNNLYFEIEGGFNKAQYIGEKNIKSIVTKEAMKSVEYTIE